MANIRLEGTACGVRVFPPALGSAPAKKEGDDA